PLNPQQAGFQFVTTEWRLLDKKREEDMDSLPIPEFPKCYTWDELQNFKGGKQTKTNLLEWLEDSFGLLKYKPLQRQSDYITTKWRSNKDNTYQYCKTQLGYFIPEFAFAKNYQEYPDINTRIYFSIGDDNKVHDVVSEYNEKDFCKNKFDHFWEGKAGRLRKKWRFPLYTIGRGHSLSDIDIPVEFKRKIEAAIKNIGKMLNSDKYSQELKDELLFFLSFFGNDMPDNAQERIREIVQQKKWGQYYHHIENAISICDADWKKQILKQVTELLEDHDTNAVKILATIFWRFESNVFAIPFSNERLSILFVMSERFIQKLAKLDKEKL
ncbi:MAG: hypothetical protein LBG58_06065, partial [Planctomycetaceae bacterium]|nr:hypothetical protein [Planctomycetaceae bacterium]